MGLKLQCPPYEMMSANTYHLSVRMRDCDNSEPVSIWSMCHSAIKDSKTARGDDLRERGKKKKPAHEEIP